MKYLSILLSGVLLFVGSTAQAQSATQYTQVAAAYGKATFKVASSAYQEGYYGVAMRRWLDLARNNNGAAQYNVGLMHFYGQGVLRDRVEAYKWFRLAEKNGVDKGRTAIGKLSRLLSPLQIREAEKRVRNWQTGQAR